MFLYNITKDNVIIVAKLVNENFTFSKEGVYKATIQQLQQEKVREQKQLSLAHRRALPPL